MASQVPDFMAPWGFVYGPSNASLDTLLLLPAPSGSLARIGLARCQIGRQLLLPCVKNPLLHRPDRDGLGNGDLIRIVSRLLVVHAGVQFWVATFGH
jgi:hypothetical protein